MPHSAGDCGERLVHLKLCVLRCVEKLLSCTLPRLPQDYLVEFPSLHWRQLSQGSLGDKLIMTFLKVIALGNKPGNRLAFPGQASFEGG